MNKSAASLKVALTDHAACIKVSGRANFTCSLDFKRLIHELSERGCTHLVLDLSDCIIMDSTFLGMLAGLGLQYFGNERPDDSKVELLNPNPRICDLLENLGVAHLFNITYADRLPEEQFEDRGSDTESSRIDLARTSLEAHRTLMDLDPRNVAKFKDVTQFLAEDLKKLEKKENP